MGRKLYDSIRNTSVEVPTLHSGAWSMSCCQITIRKKTCVISTLMISGKNKTMSHLAMNSPGFTSVFTPKEGVMPGKLRHRDSATKWWIHSFEINKTALIRLEDWFQIHKNLSFFPIWTFCIAARRTFEKTVRHRHVMTYHTSWSSDSSICQISYGSWLNLHWSSYILILGEYAATPPTIKYG